MNDDIAKAIESNLRLLTKALRYSVYSLLSYLQENEIIQYADREIVESKLTTDDRLLKLFHMIRYRDNGYDALIAFLKSQNQQNVVDQIVQSQKPKGWKKRFNVERNHKRKFPDPIVCAATNCTAIFNSSVCQMLAQASYKRKLSEDLNEVNWRNSHTIRTAGAIAFWACCEKKYEISELEQFDNIKGCFDCGFLRQQHIFNSCSSERKVEYLHRSFQEFFAALHCFTLISDTLTEEVREKALRICLSEDQVGTFFFGICSNADLFLEMLDCIRPSFCDIRSLQLQSIDYMLHCISHGLEDCSDEENRKFGLRLSETAGRIEEIFTRHKGQSNRLEVFDGSLDLNRHLCEGLNLQFVEKSKSSDVRDWYLATSNPSRANLARFVSLPSTSICSRLNHIDFLVWIVHDDAALTCHLKSLPPTRALVVRVGSIINVEINFRVDLGAVENGPLIELFSLGFSKLDVGSLRSALHTVASETSHEGVSGIVAGLRTTTLQDKTVSWATAILNNPEHVISTGQVVLSVLQAVITALNYEAENCIHPSVIAFH